MRCPNRTGLILLLAVASCGKLDSGAAVAKSPAVVRAARRAYDGAPPVIPHDNFGMSCVQCHNRLGTEVKGVGFAPPSPHEITPGLSLVSNCRQCHVFRETEDVFKGNLFAGLRQDLRKGQRLNPFAPPVRPHPAFMRENCQACHTGLAAREEIRCDHPERDRCVQCHVDQRTTDQFTR